MILALTRMTRDNYFEKKKDAPSLNKNQRCLLTVNSGKFIQAQQLNTQPTSYWASLKGLHAEFTISYGVRPSHVEHDGREKRSEYFDEKYTGIMLGISLPLSTSFQDHVLSLNTNPTNFHYQDDCEQRSDSEHLEQKFGSLGRRRPPTPSRLSEQRKTSAVATADRKVTSNDSNIKNDLFTKARERKISFSSWVDEEPPLEEKQRDAPRTHNTAQFQNRVPSSHYNPKDDKEIYIPSLPDKSEGMVSLPDERIKLPTWEELQSSCNVTTSR